MKQVTINFQHIKSVEQAHKLLAKKLMLPAYYGNNLDALFDCLTEIDTPKKFIIKNRSCAAAELKAFSEKLVDVLYDAQAENNKLKIIEK